MKRQLGAERIDLDTEGGWVTFGVESRELDFAAVAQAVEDANYTLRSIQVEVEVEGEVVEVAGATYLELDGTGQRLALGSTVVGLPARLLFQVVGWPDGPFTLEAPATSDGD